MNVAYINYEFGEIHSHSNLKYADGIEKMAGPGKYQSVYI